MWIFRELLRLLEKIAIACAVAVALAAVWAAVSEHGFWFDFRNTCWLVGAFLILMAGIGRGSNFERMMDSSITQAAWGRMPGVDPLATHPEDPTLTPGAVFVGAATVLFVVGALV
jgi:hypothetical protein